MPVCGRHYECGICYDNTATSALRHRRAPRHLESSRRPMAVCTSAQTVRWPRVRMAVRRLICGDQMLFIVGLVMVLIAVVVIPRMRVPGGVNSANLGWMSEQWLAEHRASHST
jgi:hypothetical protein